jgi:16S rRNA (cytosine967-C5)-methyltransferase
VKARSLGSRDVALQVLKAVRTDDAYANLLLPDAIRSARLDARDAGLATELTYGTLRWQGLYDAIAQQCIDRPWAEVDPDLIDVLRLGIHQLLHMRIPAHAAVDTSCELAKRVGAPGGAKGRVGFVNAVLRKVSQRDLDQWQAEFEEDIAMSHPAWIVRAYRDALGERRGELHDLLIANNEPSRPSLVARPGRISTEAMIRHPDIDPGRWSPLAGTLLRGAPDQLSTVRDGAVGVQDEGSQLVALALGRVPIVGPDHTWLDMCAGPGGKAAILEGLAQEVGAQLTAVELHPHRADLVTESLTTSRVLVGDARLRPWGEVMFDRIMLDAPCTGIGALRRRPDARWRRMPTDVTQLGPLQRELLQTALDVVRPGGVVAYVTCSPHLVETEDVVHACTRKRTDVTVLDAGEYLPELPDARIGPFVQMWPHRHGTDAMFLALLRRES